MFTYQLTIDKSTPEAIPVQERFKLSGGVLSRVLIGFPPGPCDLAHVVIYYQGYQIEPWNRDGSFHGDDYVFDIACHHDIVEPDTEVTVKGWNDDDTWEHTIDLAFEVTQPLTTRTEELLQKVLAAWGVE